MAEQESGRLRKLWEYGVTGVELAQTFWPWAVSVMTGLLAAFLRAREHLPLSEVFLMGVVGFYIPLIGLFTIASFRAISQGRKRLDHLTTTMVDLTTKMVDHHNSQPKIAPTMGMVEANIRERSQKIETWRAMITDVHVVMQRERGADARSATALLEADLRFLSLRRYLSEHTKSVLGPTPMSVSRLDYNSTMDPHLTYVLDDIDTLAKNWGID